MTAFLAFAQEGSGPARVRAAGDVDWKASGSLPPGAEFHLVYEDPKTHAIQALVRMPKGYSLPSHSHSHDETIVVLKGKLALDFGKGAETISAGGYAAIPAGVAFALKATGFGGVEFLMSLNGPFDMKGMPPASK